MTTPEIQRRADSYFTNKGYFADSCLGAGTQGTVFVANILSQTSAPFEQVAVKIHARQIAYDRELLVYLRLKDLEISYVCGHRIPILVDHDDDLLAIEMTIVSPPFCLDFGGAYLDRPPDYSPEVWADWHKQKSEAFEDDWPATLNIIRTLENYGIFIADVNPGNIKFR